MHKTTRLICLLTFSATLQAAEPPKALPLLAGTVTKVSDGDSIEVRLDSGQSDGAAQFGGERAGECV